MTRRSPRPHVSAWLRPRSSLLGFGLALAVGAVHAQSEEASGAPAVQPEAAATPLPTAALMSGSRRSQQTLSQLGANYVITLRGVQGLAGVPFSSAATMGAATKVALATTSSQGMIAGSGVQVAMEALLVSSDRCAAP